MLNASMTPRLMRNVKIVENVQQYYTCMAFGKVFAGFYRPDYETRLRIFNLELLKYRQHKFDLALCLKIIKGFSDVHEEGLLTLLDRRGLRLHHLRLQRKTCSVNSFQLSVKLWVWSTELFGCLLFSFLFCRVVQLFCVYAALQLSFQCMQLSSISSLCLCRKDSLQLYSFQLRVVRIWNKLLREIAEAQNLSAFLSRLKSSDLRITGYLVSWLPHPWFDHSSLSFSLSNFLTIHFILLASLSRLFFFNFRLCAVLQLHWLIQFRGS